MKKLQGFVVALTLQLMLVLPSPVRAQTNATYQLTDSALAVHQVHGFQCLSTLLCLAQVPIDFTGSAFGVSGNPFFVSPAPGQTFTVAGTVACSNCTGVSGAFGITLGANGTPGGFKDTGGLFQPFLGDTNGLWVNIKAAAAIGVTGTFWQTTQPVSGTFWQTTQPVSAAALPLPALAATSTKQSDGSQKSQIVDGSGNVIGSTSNNLNVQCANCSGSGVSTADNATWTFGSSSFAGFGGIYQSSVTSNPLTAGHQGFGQLTQYRALMTNERDSLGNEILGIATQAHSCSVSGYTLLGCMGQVDDDLKSGTGPLNAATATSTISTIIGAQYLASQPTMTNTQQAALLLSSHGELLVAPGTSGFPVTASLNTTPSLANGNGVVPTQGGNALGATNGIYANLLVGNAAVAVGTGAQGATSPRMTTAVDQATNAGAALVKGGVGVVNGGSKYQLFAASTGPTTFSAPTSGGATGDYLSHCMVIPTTTSPGVATILDNSTAIYSFPGGASSLSNLVPWPIPVGAYSISGAWKITLGAGLSMVCEGT